MHSKNMPASRFDRMSAYMLHNFLKQGMLGNSVARRRANGVRSS